ncbi:TVG0794961 [Thermoplasma volcanium GSS1]|uniref:TVG0794961 protein n=1 Tax=Thermoplasma volcanium (strain ATCC 51530 / DSM 4299 / JCM 9571 / NBRC 15438 / GSS1) TaxID=273116 RepID=Q97AL6_THEVO|nr:TVG0794961 [Thermoplasma volcanium GSS1]
MASFLVNFPDAVAASSILSIRGLSFDAENRSFSLTVKSSGTTIPDVLKFGANLSPFLTRRFSLTASSTNLLTVSGASNFLLKDITFMKSWRPNDSTFLVSAATMAISFLAASLSIFLYVGVTKKDC